MPGKFEYEIKEEYGVISEGYQGWTKELNLISYNGAKPKYDLREWAPEHEKMGNGFTFSRDELLNLRDLIDIALESDEEE